MTEPFVFGLELGGTKCVAVRAEGRRIVESVSIPTADPGPTLAAVDELFDRWHGERQPQAMGIASFGPVRVDRRREDFGFLLKTPKPGWSNVDLVGRYRRLLGIEVGFDTDVNAAALAEARWGGATGASCNAYVTVGTGVGVGIAINGEALHGRLHPEFGHLKARRRHGDDFPGTCPFHGDCIEGLISGPALATRSGRPGERIDDDDPMWTAVIHDMGELLASIILAVSPEKIAVGGGITSARPWLIDRARNAAALSLGGYLEDYATGLDRTIGKPALGSLAGPLGSVALATAAIERTTISIA